MTASEPVYRSMILLGRLAFGGLRLDRQVQHPERLDVAGGAVLAVTHFGYLDFALTEWAVWRQNRRLTRFLVTARAFEHPVAGRLLRAMRHIQVERTAGASSYATAVALLRAGELVGIFPEARVHSGGVGPLKTGAVRMAAQAGVPLIPVVVWGGQRVLTKGQRFSWRRARGTQVVIMVGDPRHYDAGVALDADQATDELRKVLIAMVERVRDVPMHDVMP